MMSSLEPSFISSMSDKFVELIKQVDNEYFPKVKIIVHVYYLKRTNQTL